jgi:hypothetical protein
MCSAKKSTIKQKIREAYCLLGIIFLGCVWDSFFEAKTFHFLFRRTSFLGLYLEGLAQKIAKG